MKDDKIQVLFICTGNSARSQISEGLLRKMSGDVADVFSAGTEPADEVNPLAKRVMAENGIDISSHYPRKVDQFLSKEFDIVVTTCDGARQACPAFPGVARNYHWDLQDRATGFDCVKAYATAGGTEEERLAVFRKTFAEISERASDLVDIIRKMYNGEIPREALMELPE